MPHAIVLTIFLFLQSGDVVRSDMEMSSAEECWDAAQQASKIKEHGGKRLIGVAAGCFVPVTDEPA